MSYYYLMDLALILLSTKVLGILTKKFQMPQVVGALVAGVVLGPAVLNVLSETEFLTQLSELGVIVPLLMGTALAVIAGRAGMIETSGLLEDVFIGTILTATSVSITVEPLKEIGRLDTKVGNTILAAALIDDVLGLIALTVVSSVAGGQDNIALVLLKIVLFFVFAAVASLLALKFFRWLMALWPGRERRRYPVLAFVFCLVMAYCAEEFFGVADITGSYVAGLVISLTPKATYIESKFEPVSFLMLTPAFFASVGIKANVDGMTGSMVLFSILLLLISILSKLIGCGLGAKLCRFSGKESTQVGVGMVCRGEVALIVANRGLELGVLSNAMMAPVIITVVGGTILTPIMLKLAFRKDKQVVSRSDGNLVDRYDKIEQLDIVSDELLAKDQ